MRRNAISGLEIGSAIGTHRGRERESMRKEEREMIVGVLFFLCVVYYKVVILGQIILRPLGFVSKGANANKYCCTIYSMQEKIN
jgi:hypothetical protein